MSLWTRLRTRRLAVALLTASLLGACTAPPSKDASAQSSEEQKGAIAPALRPLAALPAHPTSAAPRSQVATVNYGLFGPPNGDGAPDDGVPGDEGTREVYQRGGASWYGLEFHNRKTANGERFDMGAFTAAHRTLPFGSRLCVRSLVNGKEVLVRVNDRGPYAAGRIIDLSRAAAVALDMVGLGIKQVALSLLPEQNARCGGAAVAEGDAAAPVERREPTPPRSKVPARRR